MRVVEVESVEFPVGATIEALADYIEQHGQAALAADVREDGRVSVCAAQYEQLTRNTANRIRSALRMFEDGVQAHLDGPCTAH